MSFHMPIGHLYVFSGEMTRSSVHFLIGLLCCRCYWVVWTTCVFWKWSPCQWNHLQIFFSQFIDYLFIMFMVFFAVQKFISLISFHLSIFAFISIDLGDWAKKTLVQFMSEKAVLIFFSRSFIVSCLIFKSLSHFEFICVCIVRVYSNFFDLQAVLHLSQHHLQKRPSFLHCIFLPPLSKINWHKCVSLCLGSVLLHWSICLFLCQYHAVLITVSL